MQKIWGYSINIFLAEARPSGLKFVEKTNWNGQGIVCPRPRFSDVRQRTEFNKPGVYLLIGLSEDSGLPHVYIGEGDPIRDRLQDHLREKQFWTTAFAFISKDTNLNKAHVQYLESRLVAIATRVKKCSLENGVIPSAPTLSEAAQHECEGFLEEMLLCFPVLGVSIFDDPEPTTSASVMFRLDRKGITAEGYETTDGFVVRQGATAVRDPEKSMRETAKRLREDLITNGILIDKGSHLELTRDYEFISPSTAAGTLVGASINGRDVWKNAQGQSLNDLEQAQS